MRGHTDERVVPAPDLPLCTGLSGRGGRRHGYRLCRHCGRKRDEPSLSARVVLSGCIAPTDCDRTDDGIAAPEQPRTREPRRPAPTCGYSAPAAPPGGYWISRAPLSCCTCTAPEPTPSPRTIGYTHQREHSPVGGGFPSAAVLDRTHTQFWWQCLQRVGRRLVATSAIPSTCPSVVVGMLKCRALRWRWWCVGRDALAG